MGLTVSTPIYKARTGETGVLSTSGLGPYTLPNVALGNGIRTLAIGYAAYSSCPVVVCIEDTVTYDWELMVAIYSVAAGTLTRTQTIDSSTGSAITFGANPCNITIEDPPAGVINSEWGLPCLPGMWLGNDLGVANETYGNGTTTFTGFNYSIFFPFLWRGTLPVQSVGCYVKGAGASGSCLLIGIMAIEGASMATASATQIANLTSAGPLPTATVGAVSGALTTPLYLPPGLYLMNATIASGTSPVLTGFGNFNNNAGMLRNGPGGFFGQTNPGFSFEQGYQAFALAASIPTLGGTAYATAPDIMLGM